MGSQAAIVPTLAVLLAAAPLAQAAEHEVTVSTSFFSPNDLTIQPGDTVRWTFSGSGGGSCDPYYGCGDRENEGPAHSVLADDGSFSSGAPSGSFVFQHTFDTQGEYRYHCPQHSAPGRNIQNFMNGRIVVEGDVEQPFQINAGLNDAWFNPAVGGQGFFITVFPDIARMFVAWFTFEVERPDAAVAAQLGDAGHRWITAFGAYTGNEAVLEIEVTSGGVFNAGQPVPASHSDGTLTLEFEHCNAATVTYEIPFLGLSGSVPIQRLANDNLPACEAGD